MRTLFQFPVLFVFALLFAAPILMSSNAVEVSPPMKAIENAVRKAIAEPNAKNIFDANDLLMQWTRPEAKQMKQRIQWRTQIVALSVGRLQQIAVEGKEKPALNLVPAVEGRNFVSGQSPSAIRDPAERALYEAEIANNEKLAEKWREYRRLLDIADRGVWMLDIDAQELHPEPAARRIALEKGLLRAGVSAPAVQWLLERWTSKKERMQSKPPTGK